MVGSSQRDTTIDASGGASAKKLHDGGALFSFSPLGVLVDLSANAVFHDVIPLGPVLLAPL